MVCVGCGPAVKSDGAGSTGEDASSSTMPAETGSVLDDETSTGSEPGQTSAMDPTDEPEDTVGAADGEYFVALHAVIAAETPFQFVGTVKIDADLVSMSLTPLSLEVLSVDSPREPLPPPIELFGNVDDLGVFTIAAPDLQISGLANPITGSDIVVSLTIQGRAEGDLICADVTGMVTVPANIDLQGSRLTAMPLPADGELPLPSEIGCP